MGGSGDYFECADLVLSMDCYRPQDVTATAKEIAARYKPPGAEVLGHGGAAAAAGVHPLVVTPRVPTLVCLNGDAGEAAADAVLSADLHAVVQLLFVQAHDGGAALQLYSYQAVCGAGGACQVEGTHLTSQHGNRIALSRLCCPRLVGIKINTRGLHLVQLGALELQLSALEQLVDKSQTRTIAEALRWLQAKIAAAGRAGGQRLTLQQLMREFEAAVEERVSCVQLLCVCILLLWFCLAVHLWLAPAGWEGGGSPDCWYRHRQAVGALNNARVPDLPAWVLQGLDALTPADHLMGNLARPRVYELAAALNRLRSLQVQQAAPGAI